MPRHHHREDVGGVSHRGAARAWPSLPSRRGPGRHARRRPARRPGRARWADQAVWVTDLLAGLVLVGRHGARVGPRAQRTRRVAVRAQPQVLVPVVPHASPGEGRSAADRGVGRRSACQRDGRRSRLHAVPRQVRRARSARGPHAPRSGFLRQPLRQLSHAVHDLRLAEGDPKPPGVQPDGAGEPGHRQAECLQPVPPRSHLGLDGRPPGRLDPRTATHADPGAVVDRRFGVVAADAGMPGSGR